MDLISPTFFITTLSSSFEPKGTSDLGMFGISSKKLFISANKFCNLSSLTLRSELTLSTSNLRSLIS